MVGSVAAGFEPRPRAPAGEARREAQRALETYDRDAKSSRLADSVRVAVAGTAALQVGALGPGHDRDHGREHGRGGRRPASWPRARSPRIGLLVLPARRAGAKTELRAKVEQMREQLIAALAAQFDEERERSLQRIQEAVAPYTRFVRSERERLDGADADLRRIGDGLDASAPRSKPADALMDTLRRESARRSGPMC